MTKKKNRAESQQQFDPLKSKSRSKSRLTQKQRKQRQREQKRKENQKLILYNNLRVQDRKVHQEKYKQNLIAKKIQQEKRGFLQLKYQDDVNSQFAQIDEESVQRREQNSVIREIKELLEKQQLALNKHHLSTSAQNQFFKLQRLTEQLAEKQKFKKQTELQKDEIEQDLKYDGNQQIHIGDEVIKDGQCLFGKGGVQEDKERDKRSTLQKIKQIDEFQFYKEKIMDLVYYLIYKKMKIRTFGYI